MVEPLSGNEGSAGGASAGRVADIAALLRAAPGPLSGAEIGRQLGIGRAAVWKHIRDLRRHGYEIEGQPSHGYRLRSVPDRVTPAELRPHLTTTFLGRVLHYEESTASTNLVARGLARAGAADGTVVIADAQTAGRGRLGRQWFSPPGTNLYLSGVLRPGISPGVAPQLSLVAGCAVVAAIEGMTGVRAALKWPNDVLIEGRKVAGILTEMDSEADRVAFVIVGIGVNLNVTMRELRGPVGETATSLATVTRRRIARAAFAGRLLDELERRYRRFLAAGFGALRSEWESYSALTGREVTVAGPDGERRGRVLGVDDDGALRLGGGGETVARVVAGDVTIVGGYVTTGRDGRPPVGRRRGR